MTGLDWVIVGLVLLLAVFGWAQGFVAGALALVGFAAGRGSAPGWARSCSRTVPTRFWETDPEAWRLVIDTNVNGPFFMARAAVPAMLKAGWGRIINTSTSFSTMQRRGFTPYGPSKAALESNANLGPRLQAPA